MADFITFDKRIVVYVQDFEDHRDADDAVYELNGRELCGERSICHRHFFVLLFLFTLVFQAGAPAVALFHGVVFVWTRRNRGR